MIRRLARRCRFQEDMPDKTPCALSYDFYQEKLPYKPLIGLFMRNIFHL